MSTADSDLMAIIHREFAEQLLKRLRSEGGLSAPEMSVLRAFLKDNDVTMTPATDNAVGELADELAKRRAEKKRLRPGLNAESDSLDIAEDMKRFGG